MGETSVKIMPDATSLLRSCTTSLCSEALVWCRGVLCRVSSSPFLHVTKGWTQSRIWLIDDDEPGRRYPSLTAVAQPELWTAASKSRSTYPNLFYLEGANVHAAHLSRSTQPEIVPRRMAIGGTPNRIIYSRYLHKLVVGFTKTVVKDSSNHKRRLHFPMITLVDPFQSFPTTTSDSSSSASNLAVQNIGDSGERILGIHEWLLQLAPEESHYLIVVNTIRHRKAGYSPTGRILFFQAKVEKDKVLLTEKHCMKRYYPVYSLAPFNATSFVHCAGKEMAMHELSTSTDGAWKLKQVSAFDLPSDGIHISVNGSAILVTTREHYVVALEIRNNRFVTTHINAIFHDVSANFLIGPERLALAAGTDGTLAGLWRSPANSVNKSFTTLFEAKLLTSINHFRAGHLSPRWYREHDREDVGGMTIATALNGTVYQLVRLHETTATLLKFVQNLAERSPEICPFTCAAPKRHRLMPSEKDRFAKHVDADVLLRFLHYSQTPPEKLLQELLEREWPRSEEWDELADPKARMEKFEEVAMCVVEGGMGKGPIHDTVHFLSEVLNDAL